MIIPKPTWIPDVFESASDIADRIKFYTSSRRAFVVYSYGTTVFSESALPRDDDAYHQTICNVVVHPPDFKVMPMEDANFMIRFSGPVCGLVFGSFYHNNKSMIIAGVTAGGLLHGETLLSPENPSVPESHYYAGIYGRAKLYRDVERLQIEWRFNP